MAFHSIVGHPLNISPRTIYASGATGLVAVTAIVASVMAAPGLPGYLGAALALLVIAIAAIDARHLMIPNELTGLGLGLGLVNAAVLAPEAVVEAIAVAALRGALLALMFLLVRAVYRRLRGRDGIGLGDVKLAGVAGAWLDWLTMPLAVEIAALAALTVYAYQHFFGGRAIRATSRLPFGLFLAPAIWCCWLFETMLLAPM